MFVGKVKGSLWATRKDEKLNGLKFLVVERQLDDHQTLLLIVLVLVKVIKCWSLQEVQLV